MKNSEIKLGEAISCMESLQGTLNDYDNSCLRLLLDRAMLVQQGVQAPVVARYRVAKLRNATITADSEEEERDIEGYGNFVRWLTEPIEYKVVK